MSSDHLYDKLGFRTLLALAALLCLYGRVCAKYPQNHIYKKLAAKVQNAAKLTDPSSKNDEAEKDVRTLLPHAKQKPGVWRYNFKQPPGDWFKPGFNDSQWKAGKNGFGTQATPNTVIGTVWDTKEIWLRRSFTVDKPVQGELYLQLHHCSFTFEMAAIYSRWQRLWTPGHVGLALFRYKNIGVIMLILTEINST